MKQIITPSGGYSPAAQSTNSLAQTLGTITGNLPAAQALATASQTNPNYGATPIPQLMSEEEKLRAMFANDQQLASKYANPNVTTPAGNPAGAFSSPLQATVDSITNPYYGMDTPANTGIIRGEIEGRKSALQSIMDSMDFNQTRTLDSYKSMLNALGILAQEEGANKREEMKSGGSYGDDLAIESYYKMMEGGLNFNSIPTDNDMRNKVAIRMAMDGLTPELIQKRAQGKRIIQDMSDMKAKWDTIPEGSFSNTPILSRLEGRARTLGAQWGFGGEEGNIIKSYDDKKSAMISSLRDIMKERGNMSNEDMKRLARIMVELESTRGAQEIKWDDIYKILDNVYGKDVLGEYWEASIPGETNPSQKTNSSTVKLKDPATGEVYEWNKGDPEIEEARRAGWKE